MVTSASAPARAAVNKFGATSHRVVYASTTLLIAVSSQDSAGNAGPDFLLVCNGTGAQKLVYAADGSPIVATDASKTGIAVGAFNAYNGAAGNAQAKADAMDTFLQSQGIYPA